LAFDLHLADPGTLNRLPIFYAFSPPRSRADTLSCLFFLSCPFHNGNGKTLSGGAALYLLQPMPRASALSGFFLAFSAFFLYNHEKHIVLNAFYIRSANVFPCACPFPFLIQVSKTFSLRHGTSGHDDFSIPPPSLHPRMPLAISTKYSSWCLVVTIFRNGGVD